ncbi:MAG: beta-propeller domain-containing protein [Myxococcales bacterium]|nr:beta-propeller domain-containing protein [Myxococcales bacterium]
MRHPALLTLTLLAACKHDPPPEADSAALVRLQSCDELRDHLGDVMLETALDQLYGWSWRWLEDGPVPAPSPGNDGPTDYTTTNVQEEGVDEIDLVKTDGQYLYITADRDLQIVDSWPADEAHLASSLDLGGWASGLFLEGDRLLVVVQPEQSRLNDDGIWGSTRLLVVDVADRTAPTVLRTIDVEGWMADARMIDGDAFVVMNAWARWPQEVWDLAQTPGLPQVDWSLPQDELDAALDAARADAAELLEPAVRDLAARMELADVLPQWIDSAGSGEPETLHACTDLYRPAEVTQHATLTVLQLDLDGGEVGATGLLADGWTVYASLTDLYVAQSSWWWWGRDDDDALTTQVHRFALTADGAPTYQASGAVPGWVYDQFAMSAWDGHLRIATTDVDWWWGTASGTEGASNLFVLEQQGSELVPVGEVRGIAPGEQIQAVRMLGDRGYIVTYEQIDPLFTLDLSDPTAPALVGELEMPGFSAYLHPYGEDHLLAVGRAGTPDGQITGLAVNVFDVSDLASPVLTAQGTLEGDGWAWSEALWDHHAFTFHRDVLSIPAYIDHQDPQTLEWELFSGLVTFAITPTSVTEGGRVDHRDLVEDSVCLYDWYWDYGPAACDQDWWYATVRRSVYIEDDLFSISDYGVKVSDLNDPTVERARVLFHPAP